MTKLGAISALSPPSQNQTYDQKSRKIVPRLSKKLTNEPTELSSRRGKKLVNIARNTKKTTIVTLKIVIRL